MTATQPSPHGLFSGDRPITLSDLAVPASLRIAVAAPHPDDFDVIAIAMRFFHKNGNEIHLAVLTSGANGVEDGFADAHTPEIKCRIREAEQRESCRLFGLPASRLNFLRLAQDREGHPDVSHANQYLVRGFLRRAKPDIIFLPHGADTNVTHQRTHAFVTAAIASEQFSVVACLNEDPKSLAIRRDLVMPFGKAYADWKAGLLRAHASQQQRNLRTRRRGFDERILDVNRRAAETLDSELPFVEAFELAFYERGRLTLEPGT